MYICIYIYTQSPLPLQGPFRSLTRADDIFAGLIPPRLDCVGFSYRLYLNSRAAVVLHICAVIYLNIVFIYKDF